MFAAVVSGLAGVTIPKARSQAIIANLPGWAQWIWYGGLLIGGALGWAAILWGGKAGLLAERPARWLLAFLCAGFGAAAVAFAGARGLTGAAFIGLFAVACLARAWEIRGELRHPDAEQALRAELAQVHAEMAAMRRDFPRLEGP